MLRSFLARLHPLLPDLRRHDCRRSVALLGRRTDQIISRSYTSSEDETGSDADRPPDQAKPAVGPNCYGRSSPNHKKGHLYVVLDDWKKGFSIHKLDLHDGSDGGDLTLWSPAYRQAVEPLPCMNFAAVGRKIVAAGDIKYVEAGKEDGVTLVFDTETAGLSIVPRLPAAVCDRWFMAAAARNGLYVLEDMSKRYTQYNVAMHLLEEAPSDHWSWKSIPSPPPFNTYGGSFRHSIAVHPEGGGRAIFVSVCSQTPTLDSHSTGHTYSYDVESGKWRDHGAWGLPFHGQAEYDMELDAWVGLHNGYEAEGRHSTFDGHICSCDVVSPNGNSSPPAWKLCKERLFNPHTECASLVYMGENTYCIVKKVELEAFKSRRCVDTGNKCMICVSIFRLKYNKNGELTITARQPDHSYLFSRYTDDFQVRAFWM